MSDPVSIVNQKAEMLSLVQAGLGHSVGEDTIAGLMRMQSRLQSRIAELGDMLSVHQISAENYIVEMDRAMDEASAVGERLLGRKDFHAVFGEMKASNLFDIEEFFRENN
jgi:hypothetical protein